MQGYKLQRYKSQGRGHVITESAMRASSLGWSTQLPMWPSCPLKSLPLSPSFKAPVGGDDRVVTGTRWEGSRAQSGREFDQVRRLTIYYRFLFGTELCLVSDGNYLFHQDEHTEGNMPGGERAQLPPRHRQVQPPPLPALLP